MVSHALKCIFVHVPKTGGYSIDDFFIEHLGLTWERREDLLLQVNRDPRRGPPRLGHLTASQYVSCGHVTPGQFQEYFKFAFVRNPWDRVVSEYRYRLHGKKFDFKTFLFRHWPEPGFNDLYLHVIPQYDFLHDEDGKLLVDYVGRFERLEQDFEVVAQRLNIHGKRLPHHNRSIGRAWGPRVLMMWLKDPAGMYRLWRNNHRHYAEYYDDESREFVRSIYALDIETFGYEFESYEPGGVMGRFPEQAVR
jgi:hypothetical protein